MDRWQRAAVIVGVLGAAQILAAAWWGAWMTVNRPGETCVYPMVLFLQGFVFACTAPFIGTGPSR